MTIDDEPLEFSIAYEDRGSYLQARVSGPVDTVATSLAYWNAVAGECRSRGRTRLLVVEDFQSSAPLPDVFQVAEKLPSIVRGIQVAFVDRRIDEFEANKFGEDVAVNRGAHGRVFADEASAIRWLEES